MTIPVVWHAMEDGRGYFNCTSMLNNMLDLYDCEHYAGWNIMPDVEGAVVIVHGGRELGRLDKLCSDIANLKWVLLIFLGDEECSFLAEAVEHPNKIVWVQEPLPGRHDFADRYILDGYAHDHKRYIVPCEKDLTWSFAGQMTHQRRWECRNALQSIDWGGVIVESKGYCQGVSREEYYRLLSRAHIVPCPSGPFSPDSARIWEALECGAVPILDDLSPSRRAPGFWKYVLGDHPMPVLTDWSTLPARIEQIKSNWPDISADCQRWWARYKMDFTNWLGEDIEKLTGVPCHKTSAS